LFGAGAQTRWRHLAADWHNRCQRCTGYFHAALASRAHARRGKSTLPIEWDTAKRNTANVCQFIAVNGNGRAVVETTRLDFSEVGARCIADGPF
jgi:hypothetical protein